MEDAFRQAGIMIWSTHEFEDAYGTFIFSSVPFLFKCFDIICIESDGNHDTIERIAAQNKQTAYEADEHYSRFVDTYIDAMCQLARIPGAWIVDDYYPNFSSRPKRKCHWLDQLLGIKQLRNFSGWIESRTDDAVLTQLYLPSGAGHPDGFQVEFPISSCPALIMGKAKEGSKNSSSLLSKDNDTQLRPYQTEQKANILQAWSEAQRVMFQMPTGTGKTRLFVSLIRDIKQQQPKARILIVAHRTELIDQISYSLSTHYGLNH